MGYSIHNGAGWAAFLEFTHRARRRARRLGAVGALVASGRGCSGPLAVGLGAVGASGRGREDAPDIDWRDWMGLSLAAASQP
jgi:hypothetical protein